MSFPEGFKEELKAVQTETGLYDASSYGQIRIQGATAAPFLQRLLTNEVQKLPISEGRYQALLDRKGMVLSLFYLIRLGEGDFLAITPPSLTEKTSALLTKMRLMERISLQDESAERGLLVWIGPQGGGVIQRHFGKMPEASNKIDSLDGGILLWKEDILGPPLWNVSLPRQKISQIKGALVGKVPLLSGPTLKLLQIKAGFPEYGVDIDESHILLEAQLPYTYQRQKGCYPGQEVIERILAYGKGRTPRSLSQFFLEGEKIVPNKTEILTSAGEKAGFLTSSAYDPRDEKTFLLGYLENKYSSESLEIKLGGGSLPIQHWPESSSPPTVLKGSS